MARSLRSFGVFRPIDKNKPEGVTAALLNMLPQAALLLNLNKRQVQAANLQAGNLTGFSLEELRGQEISRLFPFWEGQEAQDQAQVMQLTRKDGTRQPIRWRLEKINGDPDTGLALLQPVRANKTAIDQPEEELWKSLEFLVRSFSQTTRENSLYLVLQALQGLGGGETLAVYLPGANSTGLTRCAAWGEAHRLPSSIVPQDMPVLVEPGNWNANQRTPSGLHRAVQLAGFSSLVWSPIEENQRFTGVLISAAQEGGPPPPPVGTIQAFSRLITSLLDEHKHRLELSDKLDSIHRELAKGEALLRSIQEGVILLAPSLEIINLNPAAENILGYYNKEAQTQSWDKVLISNEALLPVFNDAARGINPKTLQGIRLYRRNGDAFIAQVKVLPVKEGSQVVGIMTVVDDLSEREQIREHTQHLEQRALLGEVIASFAHEVKNPLNVLSMNVEMLAYYFPEGSSQREIGLRGLSEITRINELMLSVLSFTKSTDYKMGAIDIGIQLRYLLNRFQTKLMNNKVQASLQIDPECPPVLGNASALEQVFSNLITNAMQAMQPAGGHLVVRAGLAPESYPAVVAVTVADTGPGIPKDIQEHIFTPFFTTKGEAGSGLGLAICKRIMTAHKGSIQVNSFPGGTVFRVEIPAALRGNSSEDANGH